MSQFSGLYLSALAQNEMPTEREMDVSWYTWDFSCDVNDHPSPSSAFFQTARSIWESFPKAPDIVTKIQEKS